MIQKHYRMSNQIYKQFTVIEGFLEWLWKIQVQGSFMRYKKNI